MINTIFKIIGAIGLILITLGVINRKRTIQDKYYLYGGIFLESYSLYIGDIIFIILQLVFVAGVLWDMFHNKKKR